MVPRVSAIERFHCRPIACDVMGRMTLWCYSLTNLAWIAICNNENNGEFVTDYASVNYVVLTSPQSTLAMSMSMRTTTPDLPTPALQ